MFQRLIAAIVVFSTFGWGLLAEEEATKKESGERPSPDRPHALMVGDKAPELKVEKWVKGEPVKGFEKGKVYCVEFWATWCPPCIASMPHLTELQKKHKEKGLTIIGLTSEDQRNTLAAVEKMVKEKGDEKMGYTVAWDKGTQTNEAYMDAAGQGGIPCSFVVDQEGIIVYIGHPGGLDKKLEAIVAKKHDVKALADAYRLEMKLQDAFRNEDWTGALKAIDGLLDKDGSGDPQILLNKFLILLKPLKEYDKAYAFGRKLLEGPFKDEAMPLNMLAWTIVDDAEIEKRDVDLALAMALRASEILKEKDASVLDTLALAYFQKGDVKKAVETQKKALSFADDNLKEELEERLEKYETALKGGDKDDSEDDDSEDSDKKKDDEGKKPVEKDEK